MKTSALYGLASTGLVLTLSLLPTNAQPYRQFSPDMLPGTVFAAAEPGDKDFGLDGFHLGEQLPEDHRKIKTADAVLSQTTYILWYESSWIPSSRRICNPHICTVSL